jgi:hypothetical protein
MATEWPAACNVEELHGKAGRHAAGEHTLLFVNSQAGLELCGCMGSELTSCLLLRRLGQAGRLLLAQGLCALSFVGSLCCVVLCDRAAPF